MLNRGARSAVLDRLQQCDEDSYELQPAANRIGGALTRHTGLGDVVVRFDHDGARGTDDDDGEEAAMLVLTLLLLEMSPPLRRINGDEI
jgi:hypothetical protein